VPNGGGESCSTEESEGRSMGYAVLDMSKGVLM
jgi:hypothetical protein